MATFCDEIEARIATSFNCSIHCDFHGNFFMLFMISIITQWAPREQFSIYLPNSKTILLRTP